MYWQEYTNRPPTQEKAQDRRAKPNVWEMIYEGTGDINNFNKGIYWRSSIFKDWRERTATETSIDVTDTPFVAKRNDGVRLMLIRMTVVGGKDCDCEPLHVRILIEQKITIKGGKVVKNKKDTYIKKVKQFSKK